MLYINQMPHLIAEERLQRFEDTFMTNENVKDKYRHEYIARMQSIGEENKPMQKMSYEAQKMQLQLMGIGERETDG